MGPHPGWVGPRRSSFYHIYTRWILKPPFHTLYSFHSLALYLIKLWLLGGLGPPILFLYFMYILSITLESLMGLVHHTAIPHQIGRTALVIIHLHFILFSILVISSLTNPGPRDQDPIILIFSIHEFRECVTGIFSLVMDYDIIRDSGVLYMCWGL